MSEHAHPNEMLSTWFHHDIWQYQPTTDRDWWYREQAWLNRWLPLPAPLGVADTQPNPTEETPT